MFVLPTLPLEGGLQAESDRASALAEAIASGGAPGKAGYTDDQKNAMAVHMAEQLRRKWLVTYVRFGAVSWNLEDEDGPIPFDVNAVLADYGMARLVADKCDELYGETVALPLLQGQATASPRGPTRRRTSAKTASTKARRGSSSRPNGRAASKRLTA